MGVARGVRGALLYIAMDGKFSAQKFQGGDMITRAAVLLCALTTGPAFAEKNVIPKDDPVFMAAMEVVNECHAYAIRFDFELANAAKSNRTWTEKQKADFLAEAHNRSIRLCLLSAAGALKEYADTFVTKK